MGGRDLKCEMCNVWHISCGLNGSLPNGLIALLIWDCQTLKRGISSLFFHIWLKLGKRILFDCCSNNFALWPLLRLLASAKLLSIYQMETLSTFHEPGKRWYSFPKMLSGRLRNLVWQKFITFTIYDVMILSYMFHICISRRQQTREKMGIERLVMRLTSFKTLPAAQRIQELRT